MRPWDTRALTHPLFTETCFTPTKFSTAADKAWFANALARFIASDFPKAQWTKRLYGRLSLCFGHMAHYDMHGFRTDFFETTAGKVAFLEETMQHHCYGLPNYTHCDVERALLLRLRACGVLPFYQGLQEAETVAAERALLALLQAKYEGVPPAPQAPPQPMRAAVPRPACRKPHEETRQASLI